MSTNTIPEPMKSMADNATRSADNAIRSTHQAANSALDGIVDSAQSLRREAVPVLDRAADGASRLAERGMRSLEQAREQAQRASDSTVDYIRAKPVKAALIAAASGAALMGLVALISSRRRDRI